MADISVIIPCYNAASYIDRCLTTITSQTIGIDALEIICIDDASTDDTWEHLQMWESNYPDHIILVHCNENGRQGTARNIGLQYASSNWVAFIDSDDWVELDYFEILYQKAIQDEYDVVACQGIRDFSTSACFLDPNERKSNKDNRSMLIDTIEKRKIFIVLQSMGLYAWGKLIRKDLLVKNELFFPCNLAYEDCFWGSLLHFYSTKIYIFGDNLYHYFVNTTSTVLQKNTDYHLDCLTVNYMKWKEWIRRGLLDQYRKEFEFDFLFTGYLGFFKALVLRFSEPSYSYYLLLKELTSSLIPDYQQNQYILEGLDPFYRTLLESLKLPLNKAQFQQLAKSAESYWNPTHNSHLTPSQE